MDYMLFYVYVRSKDEWNMQYNHIIKLLDEGPSKARIQSAKKQRPESSSPDKIKQRNQSAKLNLVKNVEADSEENYSDEEIPQDDGSDYADEFPKQKVVEDQESDGGYADE